jgi:hypothetical protein
VGAASTQARRRLSAGSPLSTTSLYRSVMLEVERRRLFLGWPMWLVDERSGVQSGYYAKMLYADTPSGRCAGWEMLQWVLVNGHTTQPSSLALSSRFAPGLGP